MKMQICVQGKTKPFYFEFDSEPEYLQGWWDEGLDVSVIVNIIPQWVATLGLVSLWCKVQDLFYRELKP